jgi:ankyrin repeat domain-containing protein 50
VEPFSSSFTNTEPIQTINANHMSMCRFPSRDDEGYKQVLGEIQILVLEIEKKRERNAIEMGKGPANLKTASPSQATSASAAPCT